MTDRRRDRRWQVGFDLYLPESVDPVGMLPRTGGVGPHGRSAVVPVTDIVRAARQMEDAFSGRQVPEPAGLVLPEPRRSASTNADYAKEKKSADAAFEGLKKKRKTFKGKVEYLRKQKGVKNPEGLVAWMEHKATGKWPGERRKASSVRGLANRIGLVH